MKNVWDFVEVEVKVLPAGRDRRLVELAQQAAPPGARMLRKPHVAFFDLYLDSPSLALASNGAYLRVRFSKSSLRRNGTYKLFFKENEAPPHGAQFLSRREVRADLTRDEVLQFDGGRLPGTPADLAYATLDRAGEHGPLVPTVLLSSFRRYFTMKTTDPEHPDVLNLGIEQSTAFAARDLNVRRLIETGFIDAPITARVYDFEVAEAELSAEGVPYVDEMFRRLVTALDKEFEIITGSKYLTCLDELGLRAKTTG